MLVGGDLLMFGLFFALFLSYRAAAVPVFRASQAFLDVRIGMVNTVLLLTSSLLVAQAVRILQQQPADPRPATIRLVAAIGCGVLFVTDKAFEWTHEIRAGHGIGANDFFMLYYMFTGIHMLHVLVGIIMLTLMMLASRGQMTPRIIALVEGGGVFWHLVDLLWIVLFALFYLL